MQASENVKTPDLMKALESRIAEIDGEEESLKSERRRVQDALLALQGRKRPGRKPVAA